MFPAFPGTQVGFAEEPTAWGLEGWGCLCTAGASTILCSCLGTDSRSHKDFRVFEEHTASITRALFYCGPKGPVSSAGHIKQNYTRVTTNLFQRRNTKNEVFGCIFF